MILLEHNNRILFDTIKQNLAKEKKEILDITLADFDGVSFHVSTPNPEQKNIVVISMGWAPTNQLLQCGGQTDLKKIYGPMLEATPESGYDVSLRIDLDNPLEKPEPLARKISNLKRHVFAAPFKQVFEQINNKNAPSEITKIVYRTGEAIYIKPDSDRCTIIYSVSFKDADDAIFAKVFLQEFADARRSMRGVPSVKFTYKTLPMELEDYPDVEDVDRNGFVSLVVFQNHMAARNLFATINLLQTFRDYLHYHIKCSKAYMHDRMRTQVAKWLQVLNRARPDPIAEKAKKTASGRTFTRK